MKFQDISRHMKKQEQAKDKKGDRISRHSKLNTIRSAIKHGNPVEDRNLDSQAAKEMWDRENKKIGLEEIDVQELTNKILKYCHVIRDKREETKHLQRKTGVACGAKHGAGAVHEPLIARAKSRIKSASTSGRQRNPWVKLKSPQQIESAGNFQSTVGFTSEPQSMNGSKIKKHIKKEPPIIKLKDGTFSLYSGKLPVGAQEYSIDNELMSSLMGLHEDLNRDLTDHGPKRSKNMALLKSN